VEAVEERETRMNGAFGDNGFPSAVQRFALPYGFETTWAGSFFLGPALGNGQILCFGSDDGRLQFTTKDGVLLPLSGKISVSGEAINGVAATGGWLGVSTREEVVFWPFFPNSPTGREAVVFPHGAHGISATSSGAFIAPLGRSGIMTIAPPITIDKPITVHGPAKEYFYSYRAESLRVRGNPDVLVIAARFAGLAFAEFRESAETNVLTSVSFEGMDIIDFCPLFPGSESRAVAVLSKDKRLVLFKDILTDTNPLTFQFETPQGTAYRVLACHGDVYMLTSKGIYMLAKLAEGFTLRKAGERINTDILVISLDVVDANLCAEECMLIVTGDGVYRADVRALHDMKREDAAAREESTPGEQMGPSNRLRFARESLEARLPAGMTREESPGTSKNVSLAAVG